MRIHEKLAVLLLMSIAGLIACSSDADLSLSDTQESREPWAEFAVVTVAEYYRRNPEIAVRTDSEGAFSADVAAGVYTLTLYLQGNAILGRRVEVTPPNAVDVGILQALVATSGRIIDDENRPVAGADITVAPNGSIDYVRRTLYQRARAGQVDSV